MTGKAIESPSVKAIVPDDWRDPVRWELLEPVVCAERYVPAGFVTDGASVPRFLWSLFPPVGRYFVAAIVHDHALESGEGWPESNNLFDAALVELGVVGWRRRLMTLAVRANGSYQRIRQALGLPSRYVREPTKR